MAQSKNGTGKTGAFVMGCLNKVDPEVGSLQVVCISHTRELNQQNFNIFTEMSEGMNAIVGIVQKGNNEIPRCHVLCGTYGSLRKVFNDRNIDLIRQVQILVYDEADFLFEHEDNYRVVQ